MSLSQLAFSQRGAIDPAVYPNLNVDSNFWTPAGPRTLAMNGNIYVSGGMSLSVGIDGNPVAFELSGTGATLVSYTGGVGYLTTASAAPGISLLNGAISINLASIAQITTSMYFSFISTNDFTIALKCAVVLDPSAFLGR